MAFRPELKLFNMRPIFITGIGTDIGKTVVSAIITEAVQADYWKPVQAGFVDGTDSLRIQHLITNSVTRVHAEVYKLAMPASPHLAAKNEGIQISVEAIGAAYKTLPGRNEFIVIEGAGGLMVPLNDEEFVPDLIKTLGAAVILVSRNYLGSINHSLLTAAVCRQYDINVLGWIFNGTYLDYEADICKWSGFPAICSIKEMPAVNRTEIAVVAQLIKPSLLKVLE